jgi:RNA polymerase subunit RPABC4/transcription elongation factor Spt4
VTESERRCPSCRALVSEDAEWCGQCFSTLRPPAPPEPEARSESVARREPSATADGEPSWTCPTCEEVNPLSASRCAVCGTAFVQLFAEPKERVEIRPTRALAWSLLFPGLGHWRAGRAFDGVARMVLFVWTFGTVVVIAMSRAGKGGLGTTAPLFGLFLLASLGLYVTSALDAYRIASGEDPLVSSRVLLWASVGLVLLSTMLATFLTLTATRGG